jgi:hypothetical protein
MGVRVVHDIDDLANDLVSIARHVRPDMRECVSESIDEGNKLAKASAKRTAGAHGKHYHRAFSASMHRGYGLFGNTISGEYGPDSSKPQGGMSFERGSRNQPPHNDLAKSADIAGEKLALKVNLRVDGWFW